MLFQFLKYLQPTNYFNSKIKGVDYIFPKIDAVPQKIHDFLIKDDRFLSENASNYDFSWQVIQNGMIENWETISEIREIPLVDEYRFVRKYFNPFWSFYCLFLRIVTFRNPIKEISAWIHSKNVKRSKLRANTIYKNELKSFQSKLIESNPIVSVIIPTLNRYEYLRNILLDFELQDYQNFEIIVVDQSDHFDPKFYNQFNLNIKLIRQEEKALWKARNTAIKSSIGELIALSEDDVRINPDWLREHLKCLDFFNADISAGVFYPEGSGISKEKRYYSFSQQFATGNAMLYKKVFLKTGLFDRQFEKQRMGDGEFGMRCFVNGFKSISNPFASCIDVKAPTGGLRELGSWDAFRPTNWFAPRPVPSVLYYYRNYFGNTLARYAMLKSIPPSIIPYQFKRNKFLMIVGFVISVLILPVLIFQVWKSWRLASLKLKQGSLIDEFK